MNANTRTLDAAPSRSTEDKQWSIKLSLRFIGCRPRPTHLSVFYFGPRFSYTKISCNWKISKEALCKIFRRASVVIAAMAIFNAVSLSASAASVSKAEAFVEYGLKSEAKRELIDVLFSDAQAKDKAAALYLLGSIAFDERRVTTALKSWKELVKKFPTSSYAKLVDGRIAELSEIVGKSTEATISNAVARSYLEHARFWSNGKDRVFNIDTSWLQSVEAAVEWYDKVIADFPGSIAAQRAFMEKLRTLLGWKEAGRYGSSHGVKANFNKYMPQVIKTFETFEAEFPDAGSIQAFRYQIAQVYWRNKDWASTRRWLNRILEAPKGTNSFYKDLAKRRLTKVEH